MTRHEEIRRVLAGVTEELPEIRSAVLASRDGLAISGTLAGAENSRVAAMAATVQALGARVSATTGLGALEETVIRGEETTFVVYDAGEPAVLAVVADAGCNLGMLHLEGRRAAALLSGLLARPEAPPMAPPPPPPAPPEAALSERVPVGAGAVRAVTTNGSSANNGSSSSDGPSGNGHASSVGNTPTAGAPDAASDGSSADPMSS